MEKALSVACYMIKKAQEKRLGGETGEITKITPLKLQKLLYFAQGIYLIENEDPLFEDPIQAWDYGPVVPAVYRYFRSMGISDDDLTVSVPQSEIDTYSSEVGDKYKAFLDEFFEKFGATKTQKLVNISHTHNIWQVAHRSKSQRITIEKLKKYFRSFK